MSNKNKSSDVTGSPADVKRTRSGEQIMSMNLTA